MKKNILISLLAVLVVIFGLMLWKNNHQSEKKVVPYVPTQSMPSVKENTASSTDTSTVSESSLGYVTRAYMCGETPCIDIDYVGWLTGTDAKNYCAQKGIADCAPDGFVIQNDNPKIRTFPFSKDVSIKYISAYGGEDQSRPVDISITPQQFLDIYNGVISPPKPSYSFYANGNKLFQIEVKNGLITSLVEGYTP